ncbi:hypothetical protein EAW94_21825 [Salmonella enterica]|nr:hypothetical protein [Salmonella enterica]
MKPVITAFLMSGMMFCIPQAEAVTIAGDTQTLTLETTLNNPTCTLSLSPTLGTGGNGSGVVAGSSVTYSMAQPSALKAAFSGPDKVYELPPLRLQLTCDAITGGTSASGKVTFTSPGGNTCPGGASAFMFCDNTGTTTKGVGFVFNPGFNKVRWTVASQGQPRVVGSGETIEVLGKGETISSAGKVVKSIDVGVGISNGGAFNACAGHLAAQASFDFAWK